MSHNAVSDYGWSADVPASCGYLSPAVNSILNALPRGRVLDIGSGNGVLAADLARQGWDVVGVEYDKHGVEVASARFPHIRFHNYGVYDDPVLLLSLEGKFDVVLSTEAIEHLYSPHKLLEYAGAVLNEQGVLVVSTPYHGYRKNLALSVFNLYGSVDRRNDGEPGFRSSIAEMYARNARAQGERKPCSYGLNSGGGDHAETETARRQNVSFRE